MTSEGYKERSRVECNTKRLSQTQNAFETASSILECKISVMIFGFYTLYVLLGHTESYIPMLF